MYGVECENFSSGEDMLHLEVPPKANITNLAELII